MFDLSPFDRHVDLVTTIAPVVEPPPEWTALLQRFNDFVGMSGGAADQLTEALIAGDTEAVFALRTLALAEAAGEKQPQVTASVVNRVRVDVLGKLQSVYSQHADGIYTAVADGFDGIAAQFVAATKLADPEADAEAMVNATAKARTAWSEAPMFAAQLDEILPPLNAAARLCGATGHDAPVMLLPLSIDPADHHRREVWNAWTSTGRTGRWAAIVKAGITIRAHRAPASVEPYRLPKPFEERTETRDGTTKTVWYDPEDPDYTPAPTPFVYRQGSFVG